MSRMGERLARIDAPAKVTGAAEFGSDVVRGGMLHGAVLRSPHHHARIVAIDTSRAMLAPGVRAVVTGRDFPFTFGSFIQDQPFLAIDRVRFVGEPVAAVAADTERQAQEAVDLMTVQYEELPAVLDADQALDSNAPLVHPDLHTYRRGRHEIVPHSNINSVTQYSHGDVEEGFRQADMVFEDEFSVHAVSHVTLEPHTAVAVYGAVDQGYTLWVSTDRPFQLRDELATALGIPPRQVRIVVGYVGGSFGGKGTLIAEAVAVALARQIPGRPVRVAFSREEDLVASRVRMPARIRLKTGVSAEWSAHGSAGRLRVGRRCLCLERGRDRDPWAQGGVRPVPHPQRRVPLADGVHQHLSHGLVPRVRHYPGGLGLRVTDGHHRPRSRARSPDAPAGQWLSGGRQVDQRTGDAGGERRGDPRADRARRSDGEWWNGRPHRISDAARAWPR